MFVARLGEGIPRKIIRFKIPIGTYGCLKVIEFNYILGNLFRYLHLKIEENTYNLYYMMKYLFEFNSVHASHLHSKEYL